MKVFEDEEKSESSKVLDKYFDFIKSKKLTFDVQKELLRLLLKYQAALGQEFIEQITGRGK